MHFKTEGSACDLGTKFSSICRHVRAKPEMLVNVIKHYKRDRINSGNKWDLLLQVKQNKK